MLFVRSNRAIVWRNTIYSCFSLFVALSALKWCAHCRYRSYRGSILPISRQSFEKSCTAGSPDITSACACCLRMFIWNWKSEKSRFTAGSYPPLCVNSETGMQQPELTNAYSKRDISPAFMSVAPLGVHPLISTGEKFAPCFVIWLVLRCRDNQYIQGNVPESLLQRRYLGQVTERVYIPFRGQSQLLGCMLRINLHCSCFAHKWLLQAMRLRFAGRMPANCRRQGIQQTD